jgi:dihydrofolate synthase/folylpolyglutamate synthase
MTYTDTLDWMFSQLPMYQKQGKTAFKKDLTNTLKLAAHLNNPQEHFKSIHIAGTNGKGSTSHMIASVLQEAGYNVGLYTSPHLKDFRERIRVNGKKASKAFVVAFIEKQKAFLEQHQLSFFEMTVGMAFAYFAEMQVDIAVIEVGLGGRLDSTNIITPEVSVITNIGLDHTQFLGNTLELIAGEKAGIIKPKVPVVIGETHPETQAIFNAKAKVKASKIVYADQLVTTAFRSDMIGSYQIKNLKTAYQSIKELRLKGYTITETNVKNGFLNVVSNTGLLGRWQVLNTAPKTVCDTGHNKEGLTYVMAQLLKETYNTLHIVFGVVKDKDLKTIVDVLPKTATYYFCKPEISRGKPAVDLKRELMPYGLIGKTYNSVNEAYKMALKAATKEDFIFIGGSTFVVAEII